MHAPENKASERGIKKAGFAFVGKITLEKDSKVVMETKGSTHELIEILETFGFSQSNESQANCWNCSSHFVKNRKPQCCCIEDKIECTPELFYP